MRRQRFDPILRHDELIALVLASVYSCARHKLVEVTRRGTLDLILPSNQICANDLLLRLHIVWLRTFFLLSFIKFRVDATRDSSREVWTTSGGNGVIVYTRGKNEFGCYSTPQKKGKKSRIYFITAWCRTAAWTARIWGGIVTPEERK